MKKSKRIKDKYAEREKLLNALYDQMMALLEHPSIEAMWDDWNSILNQVIPKKFDKDDALTTAIPPVNEIHELDEEWIRDRIEYLSDRADAGRMYWLDWAIRYHLKKKPRDVERRGND